MITPVFLCLILQGAPQDSAAIVKALVEKLESGEIAERETALTDLVNLGSPAVPHLRTLLAAASGATRVNLIRVILKIERVNRVALLTGPGPRVTLRAKDRPAAEVLDEIQRQTGVPIRNELPPETLLSIDAKDEPLLDAVDRLCRSHGKIMYAWSPRLLRLRPGVYRKLPIFKKDAFAFVMDNFLYSHQRGSTFPSFQLTGGVVGPPGCLPDFVWIDVQESKDDRGNDLGKSSPPHPESFAPNSSWVFPQVPEGRRIFLSLTWSANPVPTVEAAQVKIFRGAVRLMCPTEFKVVATLADPLGNPSSKVAIEGRTLEIMGWNRDDRTIKFRYVVKRDKSVGPMKVYSSAYRPQILILHDRQGLPLEGKFENESIAYKQNPDGVESWFEFQGTVSFAVPAGFEISSLDLMEHAEEKEVVIPFELTDVPIR